MRRAPLVVRVAAVTLSIGLTTWLVVDAQNAASARRAVDVEPRAPEPDAESKVVGDFLQLDCVHRRPEDVPVEAADFLWSSKSGKVSLPGRGATPDAAPTPESPPPPLQSPAIDAVSPPVSPAPSSRGQ